MEQTGFVEACDDFSFLIEVVDRVLVNRQKVDQVGRTDLMGNNPTTIQITRL